MKLTEYGSLQIPDQVNLPFAISCTGDHYVLSTKGSIQVLQLRYKHINEDGSLNYLLTRFECSKEKPTGQLVTKEIEIYNGSSRQERASIMLDQTIMPNLTAPPSISNVSAVASPPGIFDDYKSCLMAHMTSMGQLTLHRFDKDQKEWLLYVDVSSTWIAHFYDSSKVFRRFDKLQPMVDEALITSFCWRDEVFRQVAHLAVGTKSGKIAIFSLLSNSVRVEYVAMASQPVRTLKWITITEDRNLLLVGLQNGKIALYSFRTLPDATVMELEHLTDLWSDEDGLIVGHVAYEIDLVNHQLLILVAKGTHLLAFLCTLQGDVLSVTIQNMTNFMITGIQQLSTFRYLVCTLPGTTFCIAIKTIKANQLVIEHTPVEMDLNLNKFSIYGLTATKTRSCWMLVGYPSKSFDHLSMRMPTVIFFCKFSERDPFKILMENPTLRLTDYYDCAEVIRFSGNRGPDMVKELESQASLPPNVDDKYAYSLKLQLIQLGARLSHYKKRCQSVAEVLFNQSEFVSMVIEILHAAKVIYYFLHVRQSAVHLSYSQLLTIRCLRNFIKDFIEDSFPGDYEHVHLALKATMGEVLLRANELIAPSPSNPQQLVLLNEECAFCGAPIPEDKQTCADGHQTFRCSITKQQVALVNIETVCEMCDRYSLDLELLAELFCADGGHLAIYYAFCCVCDMPFQKRTLKC